MLTSDPVVLSDVVSSQGVILAWGLWGGGILVGILIALAASGIYALMSLAVTQRTKEIGVRTALGAHHTDIILAIGRRAMGQLGAGVIIGALIALLALTDATGDVGQIPFNSPLGLALVVSGEWGW